MIYSICSPVGVAQRVLGLLGSSNVAQISCVAGLWSTCVGELSCATRQIGIPFSGFATGAPIVGATAASGSPAPRETAHDRLQKLVRLL
jgi:hypothetical protein